MKKLNSLMFLLIYVLVFIGCEWLIHMSNKNVELSASTNLAVCIIEWITGAGAVVEVFQMVFKVEISKIRKCFKKFGAKPK